MEYPPYNRIREAVTDFWRIPFSPLRVNSGGDMGLARKFHGRRYNSFFLMGARQVFYCDDDEDDLFLFSDVVREIDPDLQVITALESEQALQILSAGEIQPSIIFLDINIPKMSGIEVLAWLRRQNIYTEVPIIMYTTQASDRETTYCKELGAVQVLPKLYKLNDSIEQIKSTIARYLTKNDSVVG